MSDPADRINETAEGLTVADPTVADVLAYLGVAGAGQEEQRLAVAAAIEADMLTDEERGLLEAAQLTEAHRGQRRKQRDPRRANQNVNQNFEAEHPRGRGGLFANKGGGKDSGRPQHRPGRPIKPIRTHLPGRPLLRSPQAIRAFLANKPGAIAKLELYIGKDALAVLAADGDKALRAALGDGYSVENRNDPRVQHVLAYLGLLPPKVLEALGRHGLKVWVGTRSIGDVIDTGGQPPRGWPEGTTWDQVGGAFASPQLAVNAASSASTGGAIVHELGHAIRTLLLNGQMPPQVTAERDSIASKLDPYYNQPGDAGYDEFLATSVSDFYVLDPQEFANFYGADYLTWMRSFMGGLGQLS